MRDHYRIETPDFVGIDFQLAGIGTRAGAVVVDNFIMILIMIAMFLFISILGISLEGLLESSSVVLALVIFFIFLIRAGYFVFFETVMRGQTPGKRAMGIRVLRSNGLPIGLREAVIRNFLRLADMLPAGYILGGAIVAREKSGRRLGDMAADTIVVAEFFDMARNSTNMSSWGARWVARLERGESRHALILPTGKISVRQLALLEQFTDRCHTMEPGRRATLAWQIGSPFLSHFDMDPREVEQKHNHTKICEDVIRKILVMAQDQEKPKGEDRPGAGEEKNILWNDFTMTVEHMIKQGAQSLAKLNPTDFATLIRNYRSIVTDLARSQSMDADHQTLTRLNRMAVLGHNVLYGHIKPKAQKTMGHWWTAFARQVREQFPAMLLAAGLLFIPAIISYLAILFHPELAYELVPDGWIHFQPAKEDNMHDIPSLQRPIATSSIMTNNLQVSLAAFALGLTFGLGTVYVLVMNGVHLGTIAAWFAVNGNDRAFWGWVMPHGGTELLAIVVAGAAGFTLAKALVAPGRFKRAEALRRVGLKALTLELGCMVMLVIAGLVEGFISPSSIGFGTRVVIITVSVLFWFVYFGLAGLGQQVSEKKMVV